MLGIVLMVFLFVDMLYGILFVVGVGGIIEWLLCNKSELVWISCEVIVEFCDCFVYVFDEFYLVVVE